MASRQVALGSKSGKGSKPVKRKFKKPGIFTEKDGTNYTMAPIMDLAAQKKLYRDMDAAEAKRKADQRKANDKAGIPNYAKGGKVTSRSKRGGKV